MKKLVTLCAIVALCGGNVMSADNNKDDGKKVPPGLQKKGGVPPGQAKKKGTEAEEATPAAAPAAATTAAAVNTSAPASTPTAAAAPMPAPVTAKPAAAPAQAATLSDQKAKLDANRRAINQATEANPLKHKVALEHISKQTGVPIEHLKEQDKSFPAASDTGLLLGNVVAKGARIKFADVLKARADGKDWDEIAKAHNVDFGILVQKSSELAQALRRN